MNVSLTSFLVTTLSVFLHFAFFFLYDFHNKLMSFWCHFGVILTSFRCPRGPWGHLGVPSASGVDSGSIPVPFRLHFGVPLGPFGSPSGTLRGAFSVPLAAPEAQKAKKTTLWRVSVRRLDF